MYELSVQLLHNGVGNIFNPEDAIKGDTIDIGILPLVEALNVSDNLSTIASCEGQTELVILYFPKLRRLTQYVLFNLDIKRH